MAVYKIKAMKYIIRSIKYFFYFVAVFTLILLALVYTGLADSNIEANFKGGYESFWQIGLFFVLVAAVYPKFAFARRRLYVDPSVEIRGEAVKYMSAHRYILESETADTLTFRQKGIGARLIKMYEDHIILTRNEEGYYMEGLRKDVFRLASGLEHKVQNPDC